MPTLQWCSVENTVLHILLVLVLCKKYVVQHSNAGLPKTPMDPHT